MRRLFFISVVVSLFVAVASISGAETTVKESKSGSSERVGGKEGVQKKKGAKSTTAPAAQSQQDPCASVKNDPQQYAKCQDAANPPGLRKREHRGKY